MMTLIAIVGERDGLDLTGLSFRLEKHMESNPRRIGAIPVTLTCPPGSAPDQKKKLENAALTCPVHKSLPRGSTSRSSSSTRTRRWKPPGEKLKLLKKSA